MEYKDQEGGYTILESLTFCELIWEIWYWHVQNIVHVEETFGNILESETTSQWSSKDFQNDVNHHTL